MTERLNQQASTPDEWQVWDEWVELSMPHDSSRTGLIAESIAESIADPSAPETFNAIAAEFDHTIQGLEDIQADLSYQSAQASLSSLVERLDLTPKERVGLETEIQQLQTMLEKLEQQVVHIAVFGMVSRGKSSLLNALLGQTVFETGPLHGVTRTQQQVSWCATESDPELGPESDPKLGPELDPESGQPDPALANVLRISLAGAGRSRIELIDTPGIDEIDGQAREVMAREVAKQADLILFVVAGDITRVEYDALAELRKASKPMLLVFNKVDQYPEADRQTIYAKIRDDRVRELLSPDEIVMAAAAPLVAKPVQQPDGTWSAELVAGAPQVQDLKLKILDILAREGKALIALNTLLYADDINEQVLARKLTLRDEQANRIIWQSVTTKALAIALNPITFVDLVSSATIDVAMILTLSRLYGIPMTPKDAVGLLQKIAFALGGISAGELVTTLGLSSLKGALGLAAPATGGGSLVPYLSVAIAQAAIAGGASYGIGLVAKQYLARGASWGDNSPKTVVKEILSSMDQSSILSRIKQELMEKLKPA
ncbi:MAG: GTP-binding protein [Thermosynechococcaceae cyanobacterium MS004]|nr:GTP-binding protein [Thermosynechococcaceae cyanobacterium MS004]